MPVVRPPEEIGGGEPTPLQDHNTGGVAIELPQNNLQQLNGSRRMQQTAQPNASNH